MKKLHVTLTLSLLLVGSGALAQTVKVNWQIDAPFADYRTYAWKASQIEGGEFYQQWVEKDVDRVLSGKGLRSETASQGPDLYVYYHVMTQEVIDSTTTDDGFGWGGGRLGPVGRLGRLGRARFC